MMLVKMTAQMHVGWVIPSLVLNLRAVSCIFIGVHTSALHIRHEWMQWYISFISVLGKY